MSNRPPAAIRHDHEVSSWVHLLPVALASVLAVFRWTDFRCPHCQDIFRRDYLPHKVRLGSGDRRCRSCGKIFDDGAREWPELPGSGKFRCLLPPPVLGAVIALLVCSSIALLMAQRDQVNIGIAIIVVVAFLSPVLPWFAIRIAQIYMSVHRYENQFEATRRALGMANSDGQA